MPALTLWLIRHGQTDINQGVWIANPQTAKLTPLGIQQAKRAAEAVTKQPDLIVTSPLQRAKDSAKVIIENWPAAPIATWTIQEITYLSPQKLMHLTSAERAERIKAYWQAANPDYCDGDDAESFVHFLQRVHSFYQQLQNQQGFIVVVGHGQFFKAFRLALKHGFVATPAWMTRFRQQEKAHPMRNSEIYRLNLNTELGI